MVTEKFFLEVFKNSIPSIKEKFGLLKEEVEHYSENKLLPYITRNYKALNESTSQLFRNKGYEIDQLYVPLTLYDYKEKNYKIDSYPHDLLRSESKILINDSAGMGKSTVLKMIYKYSIDEHKNIPFYIDLKSLIRAEKVTSVENYILDTFPSFINQPSRQFFFTLLEETPFLFLFDGADEVPDKYKTDVFKSVQDFCSIANQCSFIVATRDEDKILSAFNSFKSYSIKPLEKDEAYSLLRKYQFKDVKAENLITELEKKVNEPVLEFLKNPLLTTLLYTAYGYKRKVPLKKSLFFAQIFESLYENHDATKIGYLTREKQSGLDIDNFEKILSHLAYVSRLQEKLEYTKPELLALIKGIAKSHPTVEFDPRGFVDDLISRVPVLRRDGLTLSWQHKSIQEYLFVRFIFIVLKEKNREALLVKLTTSKSISRFKLVLDIIYDENEELFHNIITKRILEYSLGKLNESKTSNIDKSLELFYRYISGPIDKILPYKKYIKFKKIESESGGGKFDLIRDEINNQFDTDDFIIFNSNIKWDASGTSYYSLYESGYVTCLEVLSGKPISFVDTINIYGQTNKNIPDYIQNFNRRGTLKELSSLGITSEIYVLDIGKCKKFIEQFDEKIEKRNESLNFLDF